MDLHGFALCNLLHERITKDLVGRINLQEAAWECQAFKRGGDLWWSSSPKNITSKPYLAMASFLLCRATSCLTLFTFKKLVRKGIPPALRPRVWMTTSGAADKRSRESPSFFSDLSSMSEAAVSCSTHHQIEIDIGRTFPAHAWLSSSKGQAALQRVLMAYAMRNTDVGYCQGMNFIAGLLLIAMDGDEASAFWMLAVLIEDILYKDCYTNGLSGCQQAGKTLQQLLHQTRPRLAQHLEDVLDFDFDVLVLDWTMCLFAKSLHAECTLRIWDILFTNASMDVLFGAALAIFDAHEAQLSAAQSTCEVVDILRGRVDNNTDELDYSNQQHGAVSAAKEVMWDPDILLERTFEKLDSTATAKAITYHHQMATQQRQVRLLQMATISCR